MEVSQNADFPWFLVEMYFNPSRSILLNVSVFDARISVARHLEYVR